MHLRASLSYYISIKNRIRAWAACIILHTIAELEGFICGSRTPTNLFQCLSDSEILSHLPMCFYLTPTRFGDINGSPHLLNWKYKYYGSDHERNHNSDVFHVNRVTPYAPNRTERLTFLVMITPLDWEPFTEWKWQWSILEPQDAEEKG